MGKPDMAAEAGRVKASIRQSIGRLIGDPAAGKPLIPKGASRKGSVTKPDVDKAGKQ